MSKDQIQIGFSEARGRKPGVADRSPLLSIRNQSGWPWRSAPWTAARSSCLRKVRPGRWGCPDLPCPALPCPAHPFLPAAEKLVEAKLEDVKHRLCSQFGAKGHTISEGLFLRSPEAAAVV